MSATITKWQRELDVLIEDLRSAVDDVDNEVAHGVYDDILEHIAKKHEPKLLAEVLEIVKNTSFWYA